MKKFTNLQKDCINKLYINKLYTIPDIARIFNCHYNTIYYILKANNNPSVKINNTSDLSDNQIVLNENDINDLSDNNSNICLTNNIKNE